MRACTGSGVSITVVIFPEYGESTRYRPPMVRALVVSNMLATPEHPERGSFVRDQVEALRGIADLSVDLCELPPGPRPLVTGAGALRRRFGGVRFDVVHAHYSLSAYPALAVPARVRALTVHGTDLRHPVTRQLTRLVLARIDLLVAVSGALRDELPTARARSRAQVIPCGVDLERFAPRPRAQARAALGLDPVEPCLLFPADPARAEKRYDRALAVAADTPLHTLGGVAPRDVPAWINAANAVLIPSEREGFGLAALEALACDVPVLATPVGEHPALLSGLPGTLCAPFDPARWSQALAEHLSAPDPRIAGRERAERYSATRMAERLAGCWRSTLAGAA
ncbi:MAG: glycosyltransferase [Acidobacteriota bacterium]|nr:glycosyltransferase [Acidobacteriota bacterium]